MNCLWLLHHGWGIICEDSKTMVTTDEDRNCLDVSYLTCLTVDVGFWLGPMLGYWPNYLGMASTCRLL